MSAVERPDPMAQGDLADTPFAHALMYVHRHGLSGTLAVWPPARPDGHRPDGQDRILFSLGTAVAARFLTPQTSLDVGLLPLFERSEGPYAFYEPNYVGEGPGVLTGRVRSLSVLTSGCRRAVRPDVVGSVLERLGGQPLRIRADTRLDEYGFNATERAFVELIQAEPATVDALVRTWADGDLARRVLYVLAVSRALEPYRPGRTTSARPLAPARRSSPPRPPKASTRVPAPPPPTGRRSTTPKPSLRPSSSETPAHTAPGGGTVPPGRRASGGMGGVASTGRRPVAPPPPCPPDEEEATAQRPRPPTGPPPTEPARPPPAAPVGPQSAAAPATIPPDEPLPAPSDTLSEGHRAVWAELRERLEGLDGQNYFDMLGVDKKAGEKDIRDRYFELVKRFHPDRLPPPLHPIKAHAERLFHHVTEARDTLSDPEKRIRYERQVAQGGGTPETDRQITNAIQAANLLQKAEVLSRRRDWNGTIELLDEAVQLSNEDPDVFALRAWCLLQRDSGSPALPVDEILRLLDRALELDPDHERAHYTRGLLFKRQGHDPYALWHFQKVAALNKRHLDAMREVRLAEMRGVKSRKPSPSKAKALTSMLPPAPSIPAPDPGPGASPTSSGGLLSRFFGSGPRKK